HVHNPHPVEHNFFTGKGLVQTFVKYLTGSTPDFDAAESQEYRKAFNLKLGDQVAGQYGELSPALFQVAKIKTTAPVFGMTLYLDILEPAILQLKTFQLINSFPGIERDLNFVLSNTQPAGDLADLLRREGGKWLKTVRIMDVFTHASLGTDKKSVLYRFTFQSHSKTLEDSEVNPIINKIIKFAETQFGAKLRS
ncbi:MAG: hypothetical protein ACE5D1_02140, partial [Fidelibacterota bacterium]